MELEAASLGMMIAAQRKKERGKEYKMTPQSGGLTGTFPYQLTYQHLSELYIWRKIYQKKILSFKHSTVHTNWQSNSFLFHFTVLYLYINCFFM